MAYSKESVCRGTQDLLGVGRMMGGQGGTTGMDTLVRSIVCQGRVNIQG